MQKIWLGAFGLVLGTSAAAMAVQDLPAGANDMTTSKPNAAATGEAAPGYKPEFDKPGVLAARTEKPGGETPVQLAAVEEDKLPVMDPGGAGAVGGPFEAAEDRPVAVSSINYPPCDPGPGDDRCIQLYEPGVRQALASWTHETGGLAGSQVAMGGPFEPAETDVESPEPGNKPAATAK